MGWGGGGAVFPADAEGYLIGFLLSARGVAVDGVGEEERDVWWVGQDGGGFVGVVGAGAGFVEVGGVGEGDGGDGLVTAVEIEEPVVPVLLR